MEAPIADYLERIDRAFALSDEGKKEESLAELSAIYEQIPPEDTASLGLVGSLFREAGQLEKSLYCFLKAFEVKPNSPRVSLGVFHSLWRLERYDEALDELERFLVHGLGPTDDHSRLLEEMKEGFFGDEDDDYEDEISIITAIRKELSEG